MRFFFTFKLDSILFDNGTTFLDFLDTAFDIGLAVLGADTIITILYGFGILGLENPVIGVDTPLTNVSLPAGNGLYPLKLAPDFNAAIVLSVLPVEV